MKVTRTMPQDGWVPVANHAARDHRLSWRARGLLVELLSFPDGWDITVEQLVREAKRGGGKVEGRDAMLKAMAELAEVGYVRYRRTRDENRRWVTLIEVCDDELPDRTRHTEPQLVGIPVPRKPGPGDQGVLQKTESKTETKKDLIRDEGMDAEQPKSGEGRGTRKGTAEIGEVDGWPVVIVPGEGLNGTRWADRLYERE